MEEVQQFYIIGLLAKVLLEEEIDGSFQHERVVDGNVAHSFLKESVYETASSKERNADHSIPARVSPSSHALVHDIVCYQEEGL